MKSFIFSLLAVSVLFTGCSKKEEVTPIDVREQAVGTYNYTRTSTYDGDDNDKGTLIVKKSTSNASSIEFYEDGNLILTGVKVAAASNGFNFDIAEQTIDGETLIGYNGAVLGNTKYHGGFSSETKKLSFYFQNKANTRGYVEIQATKQ